MELKLTLDRLGATTGGVSGAVTGAATALSPPPQPASSTEAPASDEVSGIMGALDKSCRRRRREKSDAFFMGKRLQWDE